MSLKGLDLFRHLWLLPVNLATEEAEIKRIDNPGK
jgi:hypothetical protein